jgi:hypothetical protein
MVVALALGGGSASADITSDRAAAILIWPNVEVGTDHYQDTVIQLSNQSREAVSLHCFYENANSHCSGGPNDGYVCESAQDCCDGSCGVCEPGWNETDFRIRLTPRQPMGWLASYGMAGYVVDGRRPSEIDLTDPAALFGKFKIDGRFFVGINGASNTGSRIPPTPETPFNGSLKCIVIDEAGNPLGSNVIKGQATMIGYGDIATANAIGVQAIEGANNGDNKLCLGGEVTDECPSGAEYNGCPKTIMLNHFFDFAESPVNGATIETRLILVPCTNDYLRQEPGEATMQYLVYNEFEQRFSTSKHMECKQDLYISQLDRATGSQRERSIFSAGVSGTLTGQTRAQAIGSGVLALANESHLGRKGEHSADFNVHFMANGRQDVITLP